MIRRAKLVEVYEPKPLHFRRGLKNIIKSYLQMNFLNKLFAPSRASRNLFLICFIALKLLIVLLRFLVIFCNIDYNPITWSRRCREFNLGYIHSSTSIFTETDRCQKIQIRFLVEEGPKSTRRTLFEVELIFVSDFQFLSTHLLCRRASWTTSS